MATYQLPPDIPEEERETYIMLEYIKFVQTCEETAATKEPPTV